MSGIDIEKLIADSSFSASSVRIEHPWLSIYKDKHNPFDSSKYKPLPTFLLKKIKFGVEVDSLGLDDATVEYMEWNDKTHKEAGFDFHLVKPVDKYQEQEYQRDRQPEIFARSTWMDSVIVRLNFIESYADSLAGFTIAASMTHSMPHYSTAFCLRSFRLKLFQER